MRASEAKAIMKRQYPGLPTEVVAFGINQGILTLNTSSVSCAYVHNKKDLWKLAALIPVLLSDKDKSLLAFYMASHLTDVQLDVILAARGQRRKDAKVK